MKRKEILSAIAENLHSMEIISKEVSKVMKLIARYPGYDKFRGNSRLDYLHEMHSFYSEECDALRKELNALPYEVWLSSNGNTSCVARGFDTIFSAEEWIAGMNRGQGRFDIVRAH